METRKDPACTLRLGSAALLQLAFLGENDRNFPWEKFPLGQQSVQNTNDGFVFELLFVTAAFCCLDFLMCSLCACVRGDSPLPLTVTEPRLILTLVIRSLGQPEVAATAIPGPEPWRPAPPPGRPGRRRSVCRPVLSLCRSHPLTPCTLNIITEIVNKMPRDLGP